MKGLKPGGYAWKIETIMDITGKTRGPG